MSIVSIAFITGGIFAIFIMMLFDYFGKPDKSDYSKHVDRTCGIYLREIDFDKAETDVKDLIRFIQDDNE